MKKLLTLLLVCAMAVGICAALPGCGENPGWQGEWVEIESLDANSATYTNKVPYMPERVACLDFGVLDVLDRLGVGDKVVAAPGNTISYLSDYVDSSRVTNVGSLRTINLEPLQQSEPDIIFISERHAKNWANFNKICPNAVVLFSSSETSVVEDSKSNAKEIAKIFGIEESVVDGLFDSYKIDERIDAIRDAIGADTENAKSFLLVLYSGESAISLYGDKVSCCSIIGHELGFKNAYTGSVATEHGDSINWETIADAEFDYLIVLNRGYVVTPTDSTLGNDVVRQTMINKVTSGKLTDETLQVLSSPSVWYQAKWGILALDTMLSDFEAFLFN